MVKQIVFLVLSAMTMEACSTEQNTMEQVRMSDVVSFGCTSSFSATESRPEYYEAEMAKPTLMCGNRFSPSSKFTGQRNPYCLGSIGRPYT